MSGGKSYTVPHQLSRVLCVSCEHALRCQIFTFTAISLLQFVLLITFVAGRPGRFHLKSTHNLMLSVSDKGRVRAELDLTPETNMLEVTFRIRVVSTVASADSDADESGDELSRVWNDLDYADEHHSIAETQVRSLQSDELRADDVF